MHHFIYPSQDTFITNTPGFQNLNFGLDEILRVGTQTTTINTQNPTTSFPYPPNSPAVHLCVNNFSGTFEGAFLSGSANNVYGYIADTCIDPVSFEVDYFSGSFIGYCSGSLNGLPFNYPLISASVNGFSGSIIIASCSVFPNWSQIYLEYQNWMTTWASVQNYSGYINGFVSGSITSPFLSIFSGSISGFTGVILAGTIVNGNLTYNYPSNTTIVQAYDNRALLQFDLTAISNSIVNGDISNPQFTLKLNVAREFDLPITYSVYAFPISESWVMGNGYVSDNGSTQGASWNYRDYLGGTLWASSGSTYYTTSASSQPFNYQVGDINMDITPMAYAWLSGSIKNNGLVLISSDEFAATASGFGLYFFSKDTNTIYEPVLDAAWDDHIFITGSVSTASINTGVIPAGISGSVCDSGSISGFIYGCFTGIGNVALYTSYSVSYSSSYSSSYDITGSLIWTTSSFTSSLTSSLASGVVQLSGLSGLITSMSIAGGFVGSSTSSIVRLVSTCSNCIPRFYAGTGDFDDSGLFFPYAGDDGYYSAQIPDGDRWVIDGQFPSMYPPFPNVPSFIQRGLDYLNQPLSLGNLDVYGWNHQNNTFAQYDYWPLDLTGQMGPPFAGGCNCGNGAPQGVGALAYSQSLYACAGNGDPCVQSAFNALNCQSNCGPVYVTISILMGTLTSGIFSGSVFTSSFCGGYQLGRGFLMGNWNEQMMKLLLTML